MASVIAAGTSYATHGEPMIPVYVFYSMFGFQRTGDQMWALGRPARPRLPARRHRRPHDAERRGPAARRTATRLLLASTNPAVVAYDPAFALRDRASSSRTGCAGCTARTPEDVFYYLTVYNEPYPQPAMPELEGLDARASCAGIYRFSAAPRATGRGRSCSPPASPCALGAGGAAAAAPRTGASPPTSGRRPPGTSCAATRSSCEEHNLLHPGEEPRGAVRHAGARGRAGPGRRGQRLDARGAGPDRRWVPGDCTSLGTDGFGRSDTRAALRRHFHVDAESIVVAVLTELARRGEVDADLPSKAVRAVRRSREEHLPADKDTTEGGAE